VPLPAAIGGPTVNEPVPLPRRIRTVSAASSLTAMSRCWSLLKSPAAKAGVYVTPVGTLFWTGNHGGFQFSRINDGIGAEGEPGPFITTEEASNSAWIGSMLDLGINLGPAKSKKNLVLEADPESFSTLAIEALTGANELYKQALTAARK
jgi:hypothetical protein